MGPGSGFRDEDETMTAPAHASMSAAPAAMSVKWVEEHALDMWGKGVLIAVVAAWCAGVVIGFAAALSFVAVLGLICALVGIRVPSVGVLGMTLLCVTDPALRVFVMTGGLLRFNTFNYIMVLVVVMSLPHLARLRGPQMFFMGAFLLQQVAWLAFTKAPLEDAILGALNTVSYFGLAVMFVRATITDRVWLWQAIMGGVTGMCAGALFTLQSDHLEYINHNVWAYVPLTAILGLTLALLRGRMDPRTRTIMQALMMVNSLWVFLSGSRGAMLVAITCILFTIITLRREAFGLMVAIGLFVVAIPVLTTTEQGAQSLARIEKLLNEDEDITGRTSGRADLFKGGWYLFTEHPLGIGTGGFMYAWKAMGVRDNLAKTVAGQRKAAHSAWIATLVEQGLIGIGLFAPFIFSFGWKGWMSRHQGMLLLGIWASVTLALSFASTEFASKGTWYLAAAATVMLYYPPQRVDPDRPGDKEHA